jgi:hypothetical protein
MVIYKDVAPDGDGRGLATHFGFTWFYQAEPRFGPNPGLGSLAASRDGLTHFGGQTLVVEAIWHLV